MAGDGSSRVVELLEPGGPPKRGHATNRRGIQSIEVGFRIVSALAAADGPCSLKELSRLSEIPPSNCHRYLASFMRISFVVQDPATGRYDLGPLAVRAGLAALSRMDPVSVGLAALSQLVDETGQTALLAILGDQGAVIVRWLNGRRPVRTTLSVGSTLPLTTSATGRIFAAFRPSCEVAELIARETGSGSPRDLDTLLADVRRKGVASVSGDLIPGLSAVAAPLRDDSGFVVAALTLVGLRDGLPTEAVASLREISAHASGELGWTGEAPDVAVKRALP